MDLYRLQKKNKSKSRLR